MTVLTNILYFSALALVSLTGLSFAERSSQD